MSYSILGVQISQTVFWAVIPAVVTLAVSTAIGLALHQRAQRVPKPRYAVERWPLIGKVKSAHDLLEARFAGKPIPQLSAARFVIWNAGLGVIRSEDVASTDPVALAVPEGVEVLQARVQWKTDAVNRFDLETSPDSRRVVVKFEFMDYGQGAIISVLHTGPPAAISIAGTLKGAGRIIRTSGRARAAAGWVAAWLAPAVLGLVGGCTLLLRGGNRGALMGVPTLAYGVFCFWPTVMVIRDRRDAIPSSLAEHLK